MTQVHLNQAPDTAERLLGLLPAIYRQRDDGTLSDLLGIIGEPLEALDADLAQMYDNWFIETCEEWVIPYLADLLGVTAPASRQEVANTLRARRRKGSFSLLGDLARDVGGWPSQGVEFQRRLWQTPSLRFPHPERSTLPTLRDALALSRLDTPFDASPRLADARSTGQFGLGHVGVYVWPLQSFPLDFAPAGNVEEAGPQCFTFSVLGNDAPLFVRPDPAARFPEGRVPAPLTRLLLRAHLPELYGEGRSLCVWTVPRLGADVQPSVVPANRVVPANLSGWAYRPQRGQVLIDPERGRLVFHPGHPPAAVWVSYSSAFSAELGGGPYLRPVDMAGFSLRVGRGADFSSVEAALDAWQAVREQQPHAVIELTDNGAYAAQVDLTLRGGESLCLRAAQGRRPSIFLLDRLRNSSDAFTVRSDPERPGGCLILDGLLITGRAVHLEGPLCEFRMSHTTLVPGWGLHNDCAPRRAAAPSLELYHTPGLKVSITHSILGNLQVELDEVKTDPIRIEVQDSILDATDPELEVMGAPTWPYAHARLSLRRCTVFGQLQVERVELIEDSLLLGRVLVARRGTGCVRYSWVAPGSRTPRRVACWPASADDAVRLNPGFLSVRYGQPAYARLRPSDLQHAAHDEGEPGVFHGLREAQRRAHLQVRLDEYTPASASAHVLGAPQETP